MKTNQIEKIVKEVLIKDMKMIASWIVRYDDETRFKHLYSEKESPKEGDVIIIYRGGE